MNTATFPSSVSFRRGTQDEWVYQSVYADNEYSLPESFAPEDVIVDVGSNVGAFAWACLERGAGRLVCFEANLDNARQLVQNLVLGNQRAEVNHLAVWRSDRSDGWLRVSEARSIKNGLLETGGHTVVQGMGFETVGCTGLDSVLDRLGPVRLLKLDAEGAEFPILFTAKQLELVQEIVGEFHHDWQDPNLAAQVDGFRPDMACLKSHLEQQGFVVALKPGIAHCLGLFFARRDPAASRPVSGRTD
jgi:FkbM family methyltransferase